MSEEKKYAIEPLFGEPPSMELAGHIPHCNYLGLELLAAGPDTATALVPYRDEIVGDPGRGVVFGASSPRSSIRPAGWLRCAA